MGVSSDRGTLDQARSEDLKIRATNANGRENALDAKELGIRECLSGPNYDVSSI